MTVSVAAVGGLCVDTTQDVDGTVHAGLFGGNAAYAAWAASLWLAPGASYLVSEIGEDFPAGWLAAASASGIDVAAVSTVSGGRTSTWGASYLDGDSRRDLTTGSGTGATAEDPRLTGSEAFLGRVHTVHCCPVRPDVLLGNLELLDDLGRMVLVDPGEESGGWSPWQRQRVLQLTDVYCPSIDDLEPEERADPAATAGMLARQGPPIVAIKLGSRGSLVHAAGQSTYLPAITVPVVDPTGAGDSYCGAFAAALTRFGDPLVAGVLASTAASFAVQGRGVLDCLGTDPARIRDRAHRLAAAAGIPLPELDLPPQEGTTRSC